MRKAVKIGFIGVFCAVIGLAFPVFNIFSKQLSMDSHENRLMTGLPQVLQSPLRELPRNLDNFLVDNSPFRYQFVLVNAGLDYALFGTSQSDQVLPGKDGWLFYKDGPNAAQPMANYQGLAELNDSADTLAEASAGLQILSDKLAENGCTLVLNLTPSKDRIYREYMPDGLSPLDISLSLIVYADSTFKVSMANKIAADLTSIGIPVKVREMSWDNYQAALKGGRYDLYYGEVALPADFDLSALLKSGGALNYGGISTGTYADVISAYLAAPDTGRAAACRTMLQTISDTAPIVPICFEKHCLYVHRGAVGGFSPTKYNIFRNITDWKISQA